MDSDRRGGRSTVWRDDMPLSADYRLVQEDLRIGHDITVDITAGQSVTLEKVATIFRGRDLGISEPAVDAGRELSRLGRYADVEHGHRHAWAHLWGRFNIEMGHDADELRTSGYVHFANFSRKQSGISMGPFG